MAKGGRNPPARQRCKGREVVMEVFRDLYLHGEATQLAAVIDAMERSLPEDWTRDKATEEGMRLNARKPGPIYCFSCTKKDHRPAAHVFLIGAAPGTLCVS